MVLFLIIVIFGVISVMQIPSLVKEHRTKEIWIFSVTLLIALILSFAELYQYQLPSPLDWITAVYKPVSNLIFGPVR